MKFVSKPRRGREKLTGLMVNISRLATGGEGAEAQHGSPGLMSPGGFGTNHRNLHNLAKTEFMTIQYVTDMV